METLRYPVLADEIAKRGIKKKAIAERLGISIRTLWNKMHGKAPFTWDEVKVICEEFFPDMEPRQLFEENK